MVVLGQDEPISQVYGKSGCRLTSGSIGRDRGRCQGQGFSARR